MMMTSTLKDGPCCVLPSSHPVSRPCVIACPRAWADSTKWSTTDTDFRRELRQAAREFTGDALTTLAEICKSRQSESARIAAANCLLDRGYGKPVQQVETGPWSATVRVCPSIFPATLSSSSAAARPVPRSTTSCAGRCWMIERTSVWLRVRDAGKPSRTPCCGPCSCPQLPE